ncbi:MAG: DUF5316 family protein [Bacillota bacterium]
MRVFFNGVYLGFVLCGFLAFLRKGELWRIGATYLALGFVFLSAIFSGALISDDRGRKKYSEEEESWSFSFLASTFCLGVAIGLGTMVGILFYL